MWGWIDSWTSWACASVCMCVCQQLGQVSSGVKENWSLPQSITDPPPPYSLALVTNIHSHARIHTMALSRMAGPEEASRALPLLLCSPCSGAGIPSSLHSLRYDYARMASSRAVAGEHWQANEAMTPYLYGVCVAASGISIRLWQRRDTPRPRARTCLGIVDQGIAARPSVCGHRRQSRNRSRGCPCAGLPRCHSRYGVPGWQGGREGCCCCALPVVEC